MFAGRQVQLQSLYVNGVDMDGEAKKGHDPKAKSEFRHTDDRLKSGLMVIGIGIAEDLESLTRNLKSVGQRDMKCAKLNSALESDGKSFNYRGPKNRFGA